MAYYQIGNSRSGQVLGVYAGTDEDAAWRACAADAGDPAAERDDGVEVRELEEYEPADESDPCQAGTYREGDYYRAVCGGGAYYDGANARTRDDARDVLEGMMAAYYHLTGGY